jgi:DNA polymerase III alpha subunit
MNYDATGVHYVTVNELFDLLYQHPDLDLGRFNVVDPEMFNYAVNFLYADIPNLKQYNQHWDTEEFDAHNQKHWLMPRDYYELDIAEWILNQCNNDAELQRCGQELLLYQERDAFDLLRYLKYLVDTMRTHNIIWGVGRGSSVASFVLYKIGVHRINSLYYDLDPQEFLK